MNFLKKILKRKILIITLAILFLSVGIIFNLVLKNSIYKNFEPIFSNTLSIYKQAKISSSLPVRLKIPSINIDAPIDSVGLTKKGSIGVPKGPSEVAWYDLSPIPGEKGNTVMDGHSGWKNGIPAVFDNLYKLKKGDKIYVESDTGVVISFVVREIKSYGQNEDAPDVFISNDGLSHLNLITCSGIWNDIDKSHSERLVVFTDKEE